MRTVDLRSDTVTRPTAGMRAAMASAEVGDDVLGDDPTVGRLENRCAELFGKPAALFVPSGTMANLLAIRAACEPGDEVICDITTHSYNYETGGPAAIAGVSMRLIHGERGQFGQREVLESIRPTDAHFPRSRMVILENTNNRGGGSVWPVERVEQVSSTARQSGLHVHIDGARLMNACVALEIAPSAYAKHADSVSMCFSKGLGAPIGSILMGPSDFITRCRRFRKMLGGGMRQVGVLAAAALYALEHHVERLNDDHALARRLGSALAELPGIRLNPASVQTNIVLFQIEPQLGPADALAKQLGERGVHLFATAADKLRCVTHLNVTPEQIDYAISVFRDVCASTSPRAAAS